ncbi:MAG: carboxypeptidase-like regulatory domain-containing protein, partial [Longimicrobiales bacterium]
DLSTARVRLAVGLALLVRAVLPLPTAAQLIDGRVLDGTTDRPIPGVIVLLFRADGGLQDQARTSDAGVFRFRVPEAGGRFIVQARALGYVAGATPPIDIQPPDTVPLDLLIDPAPLAMDGLTVESSRVTEDLVRLGLNLDVESHRVITRAEIDAVPTARDVGQIVVWQGPPGMRVVRAENQYDRDGELEVCITTTRARRRDGGLQCARVLVDGVLVRPIIAASLRPEEIQAVIVLNAADATTLFGTGNTAGAVIVYTRRGAAGGEGDR